MCGRGMVVWVVVVVVVVVMVRQIHCRAGGIVWTRAEGEKDSLIKRLRRFVVVAVFKAIAG